MQVKEIHPQISDEERHKRIGHITDEMLKIADKMKVNKAKKHFERYFIGHCAETAAVNSPEIENIRYNY